jgi:hypothetical protein
MNARNASGCADNCEMLKYKVGLKLDELQSIANFSAHK